MDNPLRIGILGLDTSHSVAFARILNNPDQPEDAAALGGRITHAWADRAKGDMAATVEERREELTSKWGVAMVRKPTEMVGKVDAVIGAYWNIELVELERQGVEVTAFRLEEHGRRLPANMGGELALSGDIPVVTAIYTFERPTATTTQYLGTQHTDFPSYIAPPDGGAGLLRPVVEQIYARYGDEVGGIRHPRIPLDPPAAANYVLFSYPPLLMDAYDQSRNNIERPSPGTIRLAPDEGMLSTDLVQGGAFPLRAVWQDADQSAGPEYLSLLPPVDRLTPPEFYVPPGIPFDPCFVEGGCSDALLQRIYETRTPLDIIYLRVDPDRQQTIGVPLRMADDPRYPAFATAAFAPGPAQADGLHRLYLPLAFNPPNLGGTGSPVGLFEPSTGRMVGYTR